MPAPQATVPFGSIELPIALLEAHERGEVVFFVGAGVSMPAGLPSFWELVEELRDKHADPTFFAEVDAAIQADYLDRAINLIETESVDGRSGVRKSIAERLLSAQTKESIENTTHRTLLRLATTHAKPNVLPACRIVTTNQDRLFEIAAQAEGTHLEVHAYAAPALPVAKRNWSGRVYLHGILEHRHLEEPAEDIVFSSADFGRAYLTEQWAANFLRDLAANHTIVFVGYGLSDPLLRYASDALAADDQVTRGASPHRRYAFAAYNQNPASDGMPRSAAEAATQWRRKGVEALAYEVTSDSGHAALDEALVQWDLLHADALGFRKSIIDADASVVPLDAEAGRTRRVLWALDEPSGEVARFFAERDVVPPLEWAAYFLGNNCLAAHHGPCVVNQNDPPELIHDPLFSPDVMTPYGLTVFANSKPGIEYTRKNHLQLALAPWLIKHASDVRMAYLLITRGTLVDRRFRWQILARVAKPDFPQQLRLAYELWLDDLVDNRGGDFGSAEWEGPMVGHHSEGSRRAHLYEAMRLTFTVSLRKYSSYGSSHIPANDGEPVHQYQLSLAVSERAIAFTKPAYATAHELEDDPMVFCRKAEGIFLLNEDCLSRLREVGFHQDRARSRQSIERLSLNRHEGYNSLSPILPLRNAVTAMLPSRESEVFAEGLRWLRSPVLAMRLLGAWTMQQVGHIDWHALLEWLYEELPNGTTPLFDQDHWTEVALLLEAFAKTGYADHAAPAARLELQILATSSLLYADADRKEELMAYNRYKRLRAIADAGATLGPDAAQFITQTEQMDVAVKEAFDRDAARIRSTPIPLGFMWVGDPRVEHFGASTPDRWPLLLLDEDVERDDWEDAVNKHPTEALAALLAAEQTKRLPVSRWSHLLYLDKIGELPQATLLKLIAHLSKYLPRELQEMSWGLGSLFMHLPTNHPDLVEAADELLLLAAPHATTLGGERDYDRYDDAITLPFGAVHYLHKTSAPGNRDNDSFDRMLMAVGEAFDALTLDVRVLWRFELTRSFGIICQRAPKTLETFLSTPLRLESELEINHATWQGIGLHLFGNHSEEALVHVRAGATAALSEVPGTEWRDRFIRALVQLNLQDSKQLISDDWLHTLLSGLGTADIASVLRPLARQAEFRKSEEDADVPQGAALWQRLASFFDAVFPKSGGRVRSQELTRCYLAIILCAGTELNAAYAALAPYPTALPYGSSEGQQALEWLDEIPDKESLTNNSETVLALVNRVFVDPRYKGDAAYRKFVAELI